ncbi:hypothetical protein HZH68_002391 [Vespula germanica]|uniref:Uncharacterized protein n=1 Tax=Vespula germanica TaxID=30212 RepID=A0A834NM74_VESGE|nr:hypothetical protein HZH68_002391 [Vespula germanica]
MVVVTSSAVTVVEDFSKDTLGRREIALSLNTRCTCKHNDMFLTRKSISPGGLDDEHNRANEGQEKVTTGLAP